MSTRTDAHGCPISLSPEGDLTAWNACQRAFLAHGADTPRHLQATLDSDPDFALAHACRGLFGQLLGRRETAAMARDAEADARRAARARPVTERERGFLSALAAWNAGSPGRAADLLDAQLARQPGDAMAMKLVQAIRFVLGDARGMRRSIETALPGLGEDHPAHGYALGCHAFALEETGEYAAAERTGRSACDYAPDDAWGLHAVAHVYEMTNDTQAGIAWLAQRPQAWSHCNNFRYHVWWHLALMHLDRGEIDAVFALYDRDIRAERTDDYRDISNAASLLSRLELEGHDVGRRWDELADICETRTQDGCLAFADLHYLLALLGAGRHGAADRLLARMRCDGETPMSEPERILAHPGLTAAEGLRAFASGEHATAFAHMDAAHSAMATIGGSHAQRDVFERIAVEAALRAGRWDAARRMLRSRAALRGGHRDAFARTRMETVERADRTSSSVAVHA